MTTSLHSSIRPRFSTIDGLAIRFAESDQPRHVDAMLFSPWPESLFAYEPTWSRLSEHARLVAIDLPGFGHSEGREALLAPHAMGEFIIRVADALDLERPHVVAPDVGTSAALFAASIDPKRFRTLVVGSGASAVPLQLSGVLAEWVEAPDLESYRRDDSRRIVTAALSTIERYTLSADARHDYLSAYQGDRFVESMRYVRAYPTELPILRDLLPRIQTPVLILAGKRDAVVPLINAEYIHALVPSSALTILDAGHFTWEDAADEYAARVTSWWDEHAS